VERVPVLGVKAADKTEERKGPDLDEREGDGVDRRVARRRVFVAIEKSSKSGETKKAGSTGGDSNRDKLS